MNKCKRKLKARLVIEWEYEADLSNYPGAYTPKEMAAIDAELIERDPFIIYDQGKIVSLVVKDLGEAEPND